jgi:hypothetical protein
LSRSEHHELENRLEVLTTHGLDHGVGHLGSMTAPDRQRLDPTEA